MTIELSTPLHFQPGRSLTPHKAETLAKVGFQPGYPLYSLTCFDPMWFMHTLSGEHIFGHLAGQPKLVVTGLLAPSDERVQTIRVPMLVRTLRFDWGFNNPLGLFVEGGLAKGEAQTWTVDDKKVYNYIVRVFVKGGLDQGYLQFIPIGYRKKPLPPSGEGFFWAAALPVIG